MRDIPHTRAVWVRCPGWRAVKSVEGACASLSLLVSVEVLCVRAVSLAVGVASGWRARGGGHPAQTARSRSAQARSRTEVCTFRGCQFTTALLVRLTVTLFKFMSEGTGFVCSGFKTRRTLCPGSVFSRQATRDARTRPAPSPLTRPSSVEPRLAALGELAERDVSVGVERRRHVRRRERVRLERGPVQLRHPTRRPHGRLQPRRVLGVAYSPVGCCVCVSCLA